MLYPKSGTIGLQLVVNLYILNSTIFNYRTKVLFSGFFVNYPYRVYLWIIDLRKLCRVKQGVTRYSYQEI